MRTKAVNSGEAQFIPKADLNKPIIITKMPYSKKETAENRSSGK